MDAVQALVKFASGLHASIFNLVWAMATLLAIIGSATFLTAQVRQARLPHGSGGGKIVAWILLCAGLVGLQPRWAGIPSPLMLWPMSVQPASVPVPRRPMRY